MFEAKELSKTVDDGWRREGQHGQKKMEIRESDLNG